MNGAHWHLLLNHIPIFGVLFGIFLLLIGFVKRNELFKNTSFLVFVITALLTIITFKTGEPAEKVVYDLPTVSHDAIEQHEEKAELALFAIEALGIISLFAFYFSRKDKPLKVITSFIVLVISLVSFFLVIVTAIEGGEIMHSEIRDKSSQ
ncbi:MAG: hypothetical protein IPP65_03970 [Chlorobi bacterium]|nr:hypothetical protein [Chlorobiota bacterium]